MNGTSDKREVKCLFKTESSGPHALRKRGGQDRREGRRMVRHPQHALAHLRRPEDAHEWTDFEEEANRVLFAALNSLIILVQLAQSIF